MAPRNNRFTKKDKALEKKIIQKVMKLPEPKHHYSSQILQTVSYTGNMFDLSAMAQGDNAQERIGDRAQLVNISMRGRCVSSTDATSYNTLRVILFIWKANTIDTGAPTPAELLQATYAAGSWTPYSPLVVGDNAKSIRVLSDRTYDVARQSGAVKSFHINQKLNSKVYFADGATSGIGKVYCYVVSDDAVTVFPSFEHVTVLKFRDL